MSILSKLFGTIANQFQLGLAGPILKRTSDDAVELRNDADTSFALLRAGVMAQVTIDRDVIVTSNHRYFADDLDIQDGATLEIQDGAGMVVT